MDTERPTIRAIIAWPRAFGHVYLSQQNTVTLDEAVHYHRMGWVVLVDPADEQLFADWQREQQWWVKNRWL